MNSSPNPASFSSAFLIVNELMILLNIKCIILGVLFVLDYRGNKDGFYDLVVGEKSG